LLIGLYNPKGLPDIDSGNPRDFEKSYSK